MGGSKNMPGIYNPNADRIPSLDDAREKIRKIQEDRKNRTKEGGEEVTEDESEEVKE